MNELSEGESPGTFVGNAGEPIRFAKISVPDGICAETAQSGQKVRVWHRHGMTSDDPLFHRVASEFHSLIGQMARENGTAVNIERANVLLFVMKADQSAELWLDTAAMMVQAVVKRSLGYGHVIFENDIADITALSFPAVNIGSEDRVICIFRESWRFAMAFDFNPERNLDLAAFFKTLGTLHRAIRYREIYEVMENGPLFERLLKAGWFPFVEILGREVTHISDFAKDGLDLSDAEDQLVAAFDQSRLDRIYERWITKPHFASRAALLKSGLSAFARKDPIPCIKTLLTEIEGILNDAYRAAHNGRGAKTKELLRFAIETATVRAGMPDTLMFPAAFARYLEEHTFANFDPVANTGSAGSRHAVGHGAAAVETYTMIRALQTILALDQLMFYT
jgi:hypothetical protein